MRAVAVFSPWVGRRSEAWGRRPLLVAAFAALTIRGVAFALVADPYAVVAVQATRSMGPRMFSIM